jgi:hypothetical protein
MHGCHTCAGLLSAACGMPCCTTKRNPLSMPFITHGSGCGEARGRCHMMRNLHKQCWMMNTGDRSGTLPGMWSTLDAWMARREWSESLLMERARHAGSCNAVGWRQEMSPASSLITKECMARLHAHV